MADAPARAVKSLSTLSTGRWRPLIVLAGLLLLLFASTSTFLVLFIGMIPSIVALVVDRTPHRHAATAVGAMNAAGVVPFVFEMWFEAHSISGAQALLSNPVVLLAMYAAAAVGWLLFAAVPMGFVALQQAVAARQVAALRQRKAELVEEWGDGIAAPAPTAPARKKPRAD